MKRGVTWASAALTLLSAVAAVAACGINTSPQDDCGSYACGTQDDDGADGAATDGATAPDAEVPFQPATPATYVPKVKTILTGLAATDAEVAAVVADPQALRGLVDQWMALPEFESRAQDFFRNAFQQNQVNLDQTSDSNGQGANFAINREYKNRLERTLMDSFPRTVWNLVTRGEPLTNAFTTRTFQLTTAQLVMLAYFDELPRADDYSQKNLLAPRVPQNVVLDKDSTATLAQSIDPGSPNFMVWPQKAAAGERCVPGVITLDGANRFTFLFRYFFGISRCADPVQGGTIGVTVAPVLTDQDFVDYRDVRIDPAPNNTAPVFWDLPALRSATAVKLHTPHLGFAGTLAFSSNWPTNSGNDARVIANQMLIVGIGHSINGEGALASFPVEVSSVDEDHAHDPACASCHVQLDPLKQYVKQTQTLYYGEQKDPKQAQLQASFNIAGVATQGTGIPDLMSTMVSHPRFPLAWANKLYFWGTSHGADEQDPELLRVADAFKNSNFDFKTLVRELFSSPLITYATATQTTGAGGLDAPSIARRDQFCTALSNRLGLTDICAMTTPTPNPQQKQIATPATMIAADGYFRAFELPALPTSPDLFFRASTESICAQIADLVIDADGSKYDSTRADEAIADFVATVMDLPPSDARAAAAKQILDDHFQKAQTEVGDAGPVSAKDALKSTFLLACLAPTSVIVGL